MIERKTDKKRNKQPAGVLILGSANLFVFGILFLIASISAYFNITPKDLGAVKDVLKQQGIQKTLTVSQFKVISIVQAIASLILIASGWGILSKKEWGRKVTLYFAYFWAGSILLTFVLHPSSINYLFIQMVYPAILVLYFTHKNVAGYFSKPQESTPKKDGSPGEGSEE